MPLSPFGKALTKYQCMKYAPDRPGILTVLPGASSVKQVDDFPDFLKASE